MVLGSIKTHQLWHWAAFGKHPSARDFFNIGHDAPLLKGFSDWVENGYGQLVARQNSESRPFSWRFWAHGVRKDNLVCGLVKDSCDSIGRPFPFLIIGTGHLDNWQNEWDLLPFACEQTWEQFEFFSSQTTGNIKKMESEIRNIKPPHPGWTDFRTRRDTANMSAKQPVNTQLSRAFMDIEKHIQGLSNRAEVFFPLNHEAPADHFTCISYVHFLCKNCLKTVPNAVFMGGTFDRTFVACYTRPLAPSDFLSLWSVTLKEFKEKGFFVTEQ